PPSGPSLGTCQSCGGASLVLTRGSDGRYMAVCSSTSVCGYRLALPRAVADAAVSNQPCGGCVLSGGGGPLLRADLRFRMGQLPPGLLQEPTLTGCLVCDPR
ncbi:hypothetical protein Vretimale_2264, partial [Volvox reticuliferus]